MKKLFFTAIATIVFNGVSMANNSILLKKQAIPSERIGDCIQYAINWLGYVDPDGSSSNVQANNIYQAALMRCYQN